MTKIIETSYRKQHTKTELMDMSREDLVDAVLQTQTEFNFMLHKYEALIKTYNELKRTLEG